MEVCAADGLSWVAQPCGAMRSCIGTMCTGWACTPGATRCAGSSAVETCRGDGSGWDAARTCPTPANASGASCVSGACRFSCAAGYADCDGGAANGCEVLTATSTQHCGACNNRCPGGANAAATCAAGRCGIACTGAARDCDGSAANGCEVDTQSSAQHCGACGNACPGTANGAGACEAGRCTTRCSAGYNRCGDGTCAASAATEACDGRGNDCDGTTDEGCGNGTCATPWAAPPAGGSLTGTFNGYSALSSTCGRSNGVDRVFRWVPSRSGMARVSSHGDYWPQTVYVRRTCASGPEVACASLATTWPTVVVNFPVTAGETYYVVIDCHYNGTAYTLTYNLDFAIN